MPYSTIRQKKGKCSHPGCNYYGSLTKGQCPGHYWTAIKMKSVSRLEEKEIIDNESLSTVIADLDDIFSQFIRLRDSDENGYVTCYCECGSVDYWTDADCMHYMGRGHMNTRFSEENCHGGCKKCNGAKKGNLLAYGNHLERDRPGSVEALEDQSRVRYDYSVSELKGLIAYYAKEVRQMKKLKPMKL